AAADSEAKAAAEANAAAARAEVAVKVEAAAKVEATIPAADESAGEFVRVRRSSKPTESRPVEKRASKSLFGWFAQKSGANSPTGPSSPRASTTIEEDKETDFSEYKTPPPVMERRNSSSWKLFKRTSNASSSSSSSVVPKLSASDVLKFIDDLKQNNADLLELDLKDCQILTASHGIALAEALARNTALKSLNLCNTKINTQTAVKIGEALLTNTSLEILNLERNAIGPAGIKAIALGLAENKTLMQIKLANQALSAGTDAEQFLAKAMAKNTQITKFTLSIRDISSRGVIDRAVARNNEVLRKQRFSGQS
ncbi:hypothetical protein BC830DRAFT_1166980, partial [Chytriomyces sp. MP71]